VNVTNISEFSAGIPNHGFGFGIPNHGFGLVKMTNNVLNNNSYFILFRNGTKGSFRYYKQSTETFLHWSPLPASYFNLYFDIH